MLNSLGRKSTRVLALTGAWSFALGSVAILAWIVSLGLNGLSHRTSVFGMFDGAPVLPSWGLAYEGNAGTLLAIHEALLVIAAALMSMSPARLLRRIGLLLLIGWSGLWVANAIWFTMQSPLLGVAPAIALLAMLACTIYRASWLWQPPKK